MFQEFKPTELKCATACFAAVLLAGCAMPEPPAKELTDSLDPAAAHAESASYAMRNPESGDIQQISMKLTDSGFSGESTSGCSWVEVEAYGPEVAWNGCTSSDGKHTITSEEGTLWPLAIGNKKTWRFDGHNEDGNTWNGTRTCEVKGTDTITLDTGSFASFRIHCKDPWRRMTFWYAPELGHTVYSQQYHTRRNKNTVLEYAGEGAES